MSREIEAPRWAFMHYKDTQSGHHYAIIEGDVDFMHDIQLMDARTRRMLPPKDQKPAEAGIAGQVAFQAYLNEKRIYYRADLPEWLWRVHKLKWDFDVLGIGWIDIKTTLSNHRKFMLSTEKIKADADMPDYFIILQEISETTIPIAVLESLKAKSVKKRRVFELIGWLLGIEIKTFPKDEGRRGTYHYEYLGSIRNKRPFDIFHEKLVEFKVHHDKPEIYKQQVRRELELYVQQHPFRT